MSKKWKRDQTGRGPAAHAAYVVAGRRNAVLDD